MDVVEYTEFLVKELVKDPESIKVECFESDEDTKIIEIIVSENDMKNIIGKNGKNASALRTIIQAFAYVKGMKKLKINIDSY